MIAFVFPGQGSQYVGMGSDFYNEFPESKLVFDQASDKLSIDMPKLCFENSLEELSLTFNAQPAILTVSIAILRVLEKETGINPDFVAGHSLGEYSALVAAGAISLEDAVFTVRKRGEFMQEAVPVGVGSMAAVIGLNREMIEEVCNDISSKDNIVSPANFNSSQQTVISGHKDAVEKASGVLSEKGAKRVIPLTVSAPFHCSLMEPAANRLETILNDININRLNVPVVTNVTAASNTDDTAIKDLLVKQVVNTVRWSESLEFLEKQNVNNFIEIGPGNVLSGLIKRTLSNVNIKNLEKPDQLNHINENENGT